MYEFLIKFISYYLCEIKKNNYFRYKRSIMFYFHTCNNRWRGCLELSKTID